MKQSAIGGTRFDPDELIQNANNPINHTGLTKVGRALDKHARGQRIDGTFPKLSGNVENRNKVANEFLSEILTNPKSTETKIDRGGVEVRLPDGRGVRFNSDSR